MATYTATIEWTRRDSVFTDNKYSRAHAWRFDGGHVAPASSSPQAVRPPLSDPAGVDPEEAVVASVASCHMLWFLSLAAKAGLTVERYVDDPKGRVGKNAEGKEWIERVVLAPKVEFVGARAPLDAEVVALHRAAHEECCIAHSLRGEVVVEGGWTYSA